VIRYLHHQSRAPSRASLYAARLRVVPVDLA
jgi:hypothetical protein